MKIIRVDNFNRESRSDSIVCENINEYLGKIITGFLIEKFSGDNSSDFFRLVDDNYKLYKFEPWG